MVGGTLYTYPDNFRAFKVLIAAEYSGAKVKTSPNFVFGETNNTKEYLAKFPTGKVPAFEADNGMCLFESNAIAYYVANEQLRGGKDPLAQSQVLQWLNFADSDILPAACTWVFPTLGIMQFNKNATDRAKDDIKKAMSALNDHLLNHTYLVGERITLADVVVACTMLSLYQNVLDPGFRKPFGNVNRWFSTIVNQPQAKKVLGSVNMADKMAQFDAKKFADMQKAGGSASGDSGKKKEKKEKPKQEPKKKRRKSPNKNPKRKKRPPRTPLRTPPSRSPRRRTPWPPCPRVPGIWRTLRGSTPTMMRTSLSPTSGKSSIKPTTPSGGVTTSTTMSSPWSLCLVTLWVACSKGWKNCAKMLSPPCVFLVKITTPPFPVFGSGRVMVWPLNFQRIGKLIIAHMTGKNWMLTLLRLKKWSISTFAGPARIKMAEISIRARFSSKETTEISLKNFLGSF